MCKYYFQTKSFLKNNLLVKALEPLFAVLSSDLKQRYFFHEKKNVILVTVPHFLT